MDNTQSTQENGNRCRFIRFFRKIFAKDNSQSTQENLWWLLFAICMIGLAIITVLLIDQKELPITIIGALLGVSMTVLATYFLFKGQSKQQVALMEYQHRIEKEQEVALMEYQHRIEKEQEIALLEYQHRIEKEQKNETEIFKQKLASYNRFIDALCVYVKTKQEETKAELKFRTAALAMHINESQLTELNKVIAEILNLSDNDSPDEKELIPMLFTIAELFGNELYPNRKIKGTSDYKKSIKDLAGVINNSPALSPISEIEQEDKSDEAADEQAAKTVKSWSQILDELKSKGWNVVIDNNRDSISLSNPQTNIAISFYKKDRFYVVQAQDINGDTTLSQALKSKYKKSSRRKNIWWRELTSLPKYGVSSGLSTAIESNDKARAVVIKWINKLIEA